MTKLVVLTVDGVLIAMLLMLIIHLASSRKP